MGEGEEFGFDTIERAVAMGCYIEMDVSATTEGIPILWHPQGFDRLRPRRSVDVGAEGLRISDPSSDRRSGEAVVYRLDDILGSNSGMHALIDVKKWSAVMPVARAIAATKAVHRVSIGTFSQARTDATAQKIFSLTGEQACTALGPAMLAKLAVRALVDPHGPWDARGHIAQPPYRLVTEQFIAAAHRAGRAVFPWTVNSGKEMNRVLDMGADGVMTDFPSQLVKILASRSGRN